MMDTTNKQGQRTVLTPSKHLFKTFSVALGARIHQKDTVLAVLVTSNMDSSHGIFDKDDRLLMNLGDGSKVAIFNVYDKEYDKEKETVETTENVRSFGYAYTYSPYTDQVYVHPYEVNHFIPRTYTRTVTYSYALYLIPKDRLNAICDSGVTDLRIEVENYYYDMGNTKRVQKIFSDLRECMRENTRVPAKFDK